MIWTFLCTAACICHSNWGKSEQHRVFRVRKSGRLQNLERREKESRLLPARPRHLPVWPTTRQTPPFSSSDSDSVWVWVWVRVSRVCSGEFTARCWYNWSSCSPGKPVSPESLYHISALGQTPLSLFWPSNSQAAKRVSVARQISQSTDVLKSTVGRSIHKPHLESNLGRNRSEELRARQKKVINADSKQVQIKLIFFWCLQKFTPKKQIQTKSSRVVLKSR